MPFLSLWLPVVVSAVAVWILSAVLHMVLKYHRADYKGLSDEASVADALRKQSPAPAVYMIPYCTGEQMKDPATRKKYEDGPVALITVMRSAAPAMGKYLLQWLLYCLFASFVAAYVARLTLHPGGDGMLAMRVTGSVAFAAYTFGYFHDSIWQGIPWSNSIRGIIDAIIYSIATGAVFCWLWPAA
jgi:hypothetical protein